MSNRHGAHRKRRGGKKHANPYMDRKKLPQSSAMGKRQPDFCVQFGDADNEEVNVGETGKRTHTNALFAEKTLAPARRPSPLATSGMAAAPVELEACRYWEYANVCGFFETFGACLAQHLAEAAQQPLPKVRPRRLPSNLFLAFR